MSSHGFLKLLNMYADRDLKFFASVFMHVWNYANHFYNVSSIHRGQEIELQRRVPLSQKGRGGKTSSKKEIKIHLICENFLNTVKSCPLALFLYFNFENHRDWTHFFQDS